MKIEISDISENDISKKGVFSWPIWSCEVSEFDWEYDQQESCLLLEGEVEVSSDIETGLYILSYGGVTIQHSDITDQSYGSGNIEVEAVVESMNGSVESVVLHYNLNNIEDWQEIPMNLSNIDNSYTANILLPADQIVISYFISASNADGQQSFYPALGQNDPIIFFVGDIPVVYSETFEFEINGWSVDGDASDGTWEAAEPTGTYYGDIPVAPDEDITEEGDQCFITGNNAPENTPSDDDINAAEAEIARRGAADGLVAILHQRWKRCKQHPPTWRRYGRRGGHRDWGLASTSRGGGPRNRR